jgi:hypothetical protein
MNNRAPAVAAVVALACKDATIAAVADTPRLLRPVRMTLPMWSFVIADRTAVLAPVAGVPTMNSCPTRWASVIESNTEVTAALAVEKDAGPALAGETAPMVEVATTAATNKDPSREKINIPTPRDP